jgi:HK97 family phage portal protein
VNFIQKLFTRGAAAATNSLVSSNLYNQALFRYLSNNTVIWVEDSPKQFINDGYYKNPDVYAAINVIVRLASVAPLNLYKVVDKKALRAYKNLLNTIPSPGDKRFTKHLQSIEDYKTKALEEVFTHKILDRLERPNDYQSKGEFLENWYGFRLTCGEAIIYKSKATVGSPEIMDLYHLPPQDTNIISGGITEPIKKYKIGFGSSAAEFDPGDIIHNRSWSLDYDNPGSHLRGISPLRSALRALTMGNDARAAQTWMLQNKGSDILLTLDPDGLKATPSAEQRAELEDGVNSKVNGKQNKGKVSFAVGKFQSHQLGMNSIDMGIMEAIKMSTVDICKVYGISPILLASEEASSFNNYREAKTAAITQATIPLLISVRDSLNKDLIPEYKAEGFMLDYDLTAYPELQADKSKQVSYLKDAWWLTPNEKRIEQSYGELPDPNMTKIYIPTGMQPIDEANTNELLPDVNNTGDM